MSTSISTAFYDSLFGKAEPCSSLNTLENETLNCVRDTLNNPEKLSKRIPPLPAILLELIDTLKSEDAEFLDFVAIIEKDPALAINVLKIANTAKYSRGDEEILSLRKAVCLLGVAGVANIATTVLMQALMPDKPIYFKTFGRQIWVHSLQCAHLSQSIAIHYKQDEFDAHFLGLIHDVGKIIIFESLCHAFGKVLSGDLPGSTPFKELMSEMSQDMSYCIAQEWGLPKPYCDALLEQYTKKTSKLSKILYKANKLSEIHLLWKKGLIDENQIEALIEKLNIDESIWRDFMQIAPEFEMV